MAHWNTGYITQFVIRFIARAVREHLPQAEIALTLDSAPCHLTPAVFAELRNSRMRLVVVPAGMTPAVQALDTHVFAAFKSKLQHQQTAVRLAQGGFMDGRAWVVALGKALLATFAHRAWSHSLVETGATGSLGGLSRVCLRALGPFVAWDPAAPPAISLEGLQSLLGPRRETAAAALLALAQDPLVPRRAPRLIIAPQLALPP